MGTLFKRKNIWYINYSYNGKQHRLSAKTSLRKLAEIVLKDIELKLFKEEINNSSHKPNVTLSSIFHRHMNYLFEHRNIDYANHVNWQLRQWLDYFESLGVFVPANLKGSHVEDFLTNKLRGKSGKTKKEYLSALKGALNRAVKMNLMDSNPIIAVNNPKVIIRKVEFLRIQDIRKIIENAPTDLKLAIIILVNTGIRLGELWALRWIDVDFNSNQLLIRSYEKFVPKGKRDRSVPMNQDCLSAIQTLLSTSKLEQTYVYRLTCNAKRLSNKFGRYVRSMGMKVRLHDLRHTFASHLIMSGTPLPVVKELLGHAHISTKMLYSHLAPNIHGEQVEKLKF